MSKKRVTDTMRREVFKRDGGACVHCGTTVGLSLQHRHNAQMGGSKTRHVPSNLMVLCIVENQALEADARRAKIAEFNGWKVRGGKDPAKVPVWYPADGNWYLLDDEYGRTLATPGEQYFTDDVPF